MEAVTRCSKQLADADIRVHVDARDYQPGFKFNDWEMRGVPVRLEIGPRDVQNNAVVAARRDIPGKEGKRTLSQDGLLTATQRPARTKFRRTCFSRRPSSAMPTCTMSRPTTNCKQVIEAGGFARGWWNESRGRRSARQRRDRRDSSLLSAGSARRRAACPSSTESLPQKVAIFAKAY